MKNMSQQWEMFAQMLRIFFISCHCEMKRARLWWHFSLCEWGIFLKQQGSLFFSIFERFVNEWLKLWKYLLKQTLKKERKKKFDSKTNENEDKNAIKYLFKWIICLTTSPPIGYTMYKNNDNTTASALDR